MTKKQCKNKISRLEGKIDEMQEQVIHYKRQVKVLDAEDSKKLLEKYHIESEELAELIFMRSQDNRKKTTAGKTSIVKPEQEETVKPEGQQPVPIAARKVQPAAKQQKPTVKTESVSKTAVENEKKIKPDQADTAGQLSQAQSVREETGSTPGAYDTQPEAETVKQTPHINPLDMFRKQEA